MNRLLNGGAASGGGAMPEQKPQQQPMQGGMLQGGGEEPGMMDGEQPTPEEQDLYDKVVSNAIMMMTEGQGDKAKVRPAIMERLTATGEPVADLANTAVTIVQTVVASAKQNKIEVPGDVLYHAGREVVEHLVELAEKAGVHDFSERDMEGAWYQALDLYREQGTQAGMVDAEPLKSEWNSIVEADKQGRLAEMLPGFDEAAARSETSNPEEAEG